MRSIEGHFTIVNQPGTAHELAQELLSMFESTKSPETIIISETTIEDAASRAQNVLISSLEQSIRKIDKQLEAIQENTETIRYASIDKAQQSVLDATSQAERMSTSKNWRKLDKAQKKLSKELVSAGFSTYTDYVDFLNNQAGNSDEKRELLLAKDEMIAQKTEVENSSRSISCLTPGQIITVLADVLSRAPHTPMGPLPIVISDALRNVDVATKLRAMEVLKAHSSHYATWYVTDDPIVLSWAGFFDEVELSQNDSKIFDIEKI